MLKFAIQSTLQKTQKADYKPTYLLNITGKENILLFAKYIGVFGEKQAILDNLIKSFETVQSIPNQDIIPKNIWNEIRKNLKEQCISVRSFQQQLGTAYCGSGLYKSNLSRQRLAKIADILENSDLQKIATSDLKWDKITQITQIGREMTYDLHIEQYHNFVANHFIIHNSGAIEQDADIVGFIYRPEYYGIMEDEEGNSLKGIGEVIIAKHRNGALDTVRLKWDGQYAKFSNLDDNFAQDFQAFDNNNYDNGQSLPSKINNPSPPKSSNYSDDVPF